ncbi:MAG: aspartate--ammonia ligase [Clostridiales bacterium]|jgi:aspartate--ammonia ligase|nr:aspartate--ammonia ligase [Clostridiales bacterium]
MKERIIIPKAYPKNMTIRETEICIKFIKDYFERALAAALNLTRVSAPLFVKPETGLNDNLNGVERPVSFGILEQDDAVCEIVHSLAKWKRVALLNYEFAEGEGLYTDMNAIRRDEITDNLHSIYVDQWDWELIMSKEDRNLEFLKQIVRRIYSVVLETEARVAGKFGVPKKLPSDIVFMSTYELEDSYPALTPKQREYEAAKKYGAVFITQIGGRLKSGEKHDGRAPDYDDWKLNGDIILYYPLLDCAFEVSSMGIRVDKQALIEQLTAENCLDRLNLQFQRALADGRLPQTIGGGIGQSRLCMFLLNKAHIGEVQASVWPDEDIKLCEENGIKLL